MKARLKDPDLARLFENTIPNTLGEFVWCMRLCSFLKLFLDTTVKYFNEVSVIRESLNLNHGINYL